MKYLITIPTPDNTYSHKWSLNTHDYVEAVTRCLSAYNEYYKTKLTSLPHNTKIETIENNQNQHGN